MQEAKQILACNKGNGWDQPEKINLIANPQGADLIKRLSKSPPPPPQPREYFLVMANGVVLLSLLALTIMGLYIFGILGPSAENYGTVGIYK